MPEFVLRTAKTAPCPEVTSCQHIFFLRSFQNFLKNSLVVRVAQGGWSIQRVQMIVARETELFHYGRFFQPAGYFEMQIDIISGAINRILERSFHIVSVHPAPVFGPHMESEIIDVRIAVYFFEKRDIFFATVFSFGAQTNHMIFVKRLYVSGHFGNPDSKRRFVFVGKCAGLIPNLPRENSRIFAVFFAGISICACNYFFDMLFQHFVTFAASGVLLYIFHVGRPSVHRRHGIFALSGPVEVLTVTARPFP